MNEILARADACETAALGGAVKKPAAVPVERDVYSHLAMARTRRAAYHGIANGAAMARVDDERPAHERAQRFEGVEKGRIVPVFSPAATIVTAAGEFLRPEMRPAPIRERNIFVRRVEHACSITPRMTLQDWETVEFCSEPRWPRGGWDSDS